MYSQPLPDLEKDDWEKLSRRVYRANADGLPVPDMDPGIGTAMRELGQSGDPWRYFDALADTPTLVLHGVLSDVLSPGTLARMHARMPDLQSIEVPNRGHVPMLNEPECLAAIDGFLQALPG